MVDLYPSSRAVSRVHEFVSYDHICINLNKIVLVGRLMTLFYLCAVPRIRMSYDYICIKNKLVLVGRLMTLFYLCAVPRIRKKEVGQVVHGIQIITRKYHVKMMYVFLFVCFFFFFVVVVEIVLDFISALQNK